jgi:hypothetical protein
MTVADHAGADDPDSAITKRAAVSSVRMTTKVTSPFQPWPSVTSSAAMPTSRSPVCAS